jgi:hypothetical protein
MSKVCSVFISSTCEDLKEHRLAAREAVLAVGLRPEMQEYFAAAANPPLAECMERVRPCELVIVLVAHRYGWVPPDQVDGEAKSITWLECEQARDLLVFVLDKDAAWPVERTEAYRLTAAFNEGTFTPGLPAEVQRNIEKLKEFRGSLDNGRTRATFTTPDDLRAKVVQALYQWLEKHPDCKPARKTVDPRPYLEWLRTRTATIDIRGLGVGAGKAHAFPIEELYIPLTTPREAAARVPGMAEMAARERMELQDALTHRRLVIIGDPGSGKTTFLRRITFALSNAALGIVDSASIPAKPGILEWLRSLLRGGRGAPFPLLIRVAELCEHVELYAQQSREPDSPEWLSHFLATRNAALGWGLSEEFFSEKLSQGDAVVLLDGLDEAADSAGRERAARLFENATARYSGSRFVVTTRPQAYGGGALLQGFHEARIEPLAPDAVETFLDRWCRGLFPESAQKAEEHRKELSEALRVRPEIRSMARNPVMLTALAVVHWHERRLPEQRADLYDAILTWLSRQREMRPGREKAERCLMLLGELALSMHADPEGRKVRVALPWAARALARHFGRGSEAAQEFLEEETADSGIIVTRGGELQFWHLTFQEYLAAQAVAGQVEPKMLFESERIYSAEWREVVLLLAGILLVRQRSKARVDELVSAILDGCGKNLSGQARAVGLLGAIVGDLKPAGYELADPRYRELRNAVLGIFDRNQAHEVPFQVRLEAAEALGKAGDPRLARENWVRIEGGGAVKTFEIGRYPVTVAEFRRFVEDGGYQQERWWEVGRFGERSALDQWVEQTEHPNWPVTGVSWYAAKAYCAWAGVRLPSEAEWAWAARGKEGREYPWGREEPDAPRANYGETGPGHATPVGLYPAGATPEGIEDMAGNVLEWVEDAAEGGKLRVVRGGSWRVDVSKLGSEARLKAEPAFRYYYVGFRVAREVSFP